MEDLGTEDDGGVDVSISDEVQSDSDLIAGTTRPEDDAGQDTL